MDIDVKVDRCVVVEKILCDLKIIVNEIGVIIVLFL